MIVTQPILPVDAAREQIASQVEQYLAAGGRIVEVPIGVSGESDASIWSKGKLVVSDAPKPKAVPKRQPGPPDMKSANDGKRRKAAEDRRILAGAIRHCAQQDMSISAAAEAVGVTRAHIRKIAAEHNIQFGKETACTVS